MIINPPRSDHPNPVALETLTGSLPPPQAIDLAMLAARVAAGRRLVVLDDDPTGTQSITDLPVLLTWTVDDLRWAFQQPSNGFFILTNTRSLSPDAAELLNREIVAALHEAATIEGAHYSIASRSDSTLRGHYPLETDVLTQELAQRGIRVDGVLIVPAYLDTGRITIDSVHWTPDDDGMIPVAQSESARDATFGFTHSDLRQWVQEKSHGAIASSTVLTINLATLRGGGVDAVLSVLRSCQNAQPVVVDAVAESDLHMLAAAVLEAESEGMTFLYRTGPSFVRARVGQPASSPVSRAQFRRIFRTPTSAQDLRPDVPRGLIVIGSHVGRTTRQLEILRRTAEIVEVEVDVNVLIDPHRRRQLITATSAEASFHLLTGGNDVVVRSSRALVAGSGPAASLEIARMVSSALVEVVRSAMGQVRPAFVLAKGGITSADTATLGLSMHRAWSRGTMLPGIVSVWEPVTGSAVGIPYIVFAGNVGDNDALRFVVQALSGLGTSTAEDE